MSLTADIWFFFKLWPKWSVLSKNYLYIIYDSVFLFDTNSVFGGVLDKK